MLDIKAVIETGKTLYIPGWNAMTETTIKEIEMVDGAYVVVKVSGVYEKLYTKDGKLYEDDIEDNVVAYADRREAIQVFKATLDERIKDITKRNEELQKLLELRDSL